MENKTSIQRKDTRYVQGGRSTVKKKRLTWWERSPEFTKRADDDLIIYSLPARYAGRPDLLSYELYQTNNLEWVILQYNNIVDINEEFITGATLILPTKSRLFSSMLIRTVNTEGEDV